MDGAAGSIPAGPGSFSTLVGDALKHTKALYFLGAGLLFYVYPFVVLAWTALEGSAAAEDCDPAAQGSALCRCRRRRGGGKGDAEKSQPKCSPGWLDNVLALVSTWARGLQYTAVLLILAVRLVIYSLSYAPWFLQIGYDYFHNPRILRRIRYGSNSRNYLDIYFPTEAMATAESVAGAEKKLPVVVTVMGGAWMIGHRLWNVLLGMRLSQAGVLVIGVDYRNFPGGEMHDMVEDVGRAIEWVFSNVSQYHGDPKHVLLIGQSAGAHLEAMVLLERCMAEARGEVSSQAWSPKDIKGFFGVCGPYDFVAFETHLASRGIYNALPHLCAGRDVIRYSPTRLLATPAWKAVAAEAAARMPPVHLYAGELDKSVPATSSTAFVHALRRAGVEKVTLEVGVGVRHAEPVVEDPLTGGDLQIKLMLPLLPKEVSSKLETLKPPYPQVPKALASFALRVMPF